MLYGTNELSGKSSGVNWGNYCWRSDLVSRYESLWSILQKFALLNAIETVEIREIFGQSPFNTDVSNWSWGNREDLKQFGGLDFYKLVECFQRDTLKIDESVVTPFVRYSEISSLGCKNLRFCEKCFRDGFHSALYQLLFFTKCPIHNEQFTTYCPGCKREIPYLLGSKSFKKPYGCPNCSFIFCNLLSKLGCRLPEVKGREKILQTISEWLFVRTRARNIEKNIKTTNNLGKLENGTDNITSSLIMFWSDIFKVDEELQVTLNRQISKNSNTIGIRICFRSVSLKDKKERTDLFDKDFDKELYGIYKSIGRHILKTRLKDHSSCIEDCGRNLWWDRYALDCKGRICVYANAFLLWRMYYESLDHPILLFKKFKGKVPERAHIYWEPPSYKFSEAVLKRIFALECFWVFYECKLLAEKFNAQGIYSFNTAQHITNSFVPHWLVEEYPEKPNGELFEIYYRLQVSRLEEFSNFGEAHEL